MFNISILLLILAVTAYYYSGLRTRELAVAAAKNYCQNLQLQLLDQSVSLSHTRIVMRRHTVLAFQRNYRFEFTATGDERYHGKISMLNQHIQSVWLQPHRLPDSDLNTETLH